MGMTSDAGTQVYTYAPGSHRLTHVGGEARGHDAAGNTTSIGSREYAYSDANRLRQAKQGGAVLETYLYNHRGERIQRETTGSSAQLTVYDEAGQWLGNYSSTGQVMQQAIWLDNYPVALINAPAAGVPEVAYIQPDHLGTPRVVIDPVRNLSIWEWSSKSEVFGNQAPNSDPDGDGVAFELALRFPGHEFDSSSSLNYNGYRYYDSDTGRYVSPDPLGLLGDITLYAYAKSNPTGWVDPDGMQPYPVIAGPGAAGASAAASAAAVYDQDYPMSDPGSVDFGPKITLNDAKSALNLAGMMQIQNWGSTIYEVMSVAKPLILAACSAEDDTDRCEEEWARARSLCRQLIYEQMQQAAGRRKKRSVTGVTGGYTDVERCAMGLVSQACGGNKIK